jgi:hypothetical protein
VEIENLNKTPYYSKNIKERVATTQTEIRRLLWGLQSDLTGFELEVEIGGQDRGFKCKITVKI